MADSGRHLIVYPRHCDSNHERKAQFANELSNARWFAANKTLQEIFQLMHRKIEDTTCDVYHSKEFVICRDLFSYRDPAQMENLFSHPILAGEY